MTGWLATAEWAALMTVPVVLVTYVLPKVDAWLDRRQAEREVVRGAVQLCRDDAGRQQFDDVFLDIVTTRLADLEVGRPQDGL